MPVKFHIHTKPAPPRVRPIGKMGIIDWREDCSTCHNCVKKDCVYGFYRDEADRLQDQLEALWEVKGGYQVRTSYLFTPLLDRDSSERPIH